MYRSTGTLTTSSGVLFKSFNRMVYELNRNRKIVYQKQRLEAWREMARQVVHEIKNPLTPIQLSAERIRKRYIENHPDIQEHHHGGDRDHSRGSGRAEEHPAANSPSSRAFPR